MKHLKRSMLVGMLVIALTTLLTPAMVEAAGKWSIVKSPNPGTNDDNLYSVAAISATDIWTVGLENPTSDQALTEHWNGTSWQVVSSPKIGSYDNVLFGVAAVSATNVWAVGIRPNLHGPGFVTLAEHWNGTNWQVVSSPNPGHHNEFRGVAAVSATDIWAVGVYLTSSNVEQTLTEHWNGTSWQVVSSPNVGSGGSSLSSVAVVSANDVWAVGNYTTSSGVDQTLIEHWNGTSWQVVTSPNIPANNNDLVGVARVPGSSSLWAVGKHFSNSGPLKTLTEFSG